MAKEFFVLNNGRVLYAPGHYEQKDAETIAENAARRHPGRTFTVVRIVGKYQVEPEQGSLKLRRSRK